MEKNKFILCLEQKNNNEIEEIVLEIRKKLSLNSRRDYGKMKCIEDIISIALKDKKALIIKLLSEYKK